MRIGIYGGTFNPIHTGHINILNGFHKALNLDKIIVIPTATPPHKKSLDLASSNHRLKMCEIALENFDYCVISDIEIMREGKSYTIDTINELKKTYINDDFFLLMGEDMFMIIDKWREFEKIFDICTICCAPRSLDGMIEIQKFANSVKKEYNNLNYELVNIEYVEASSTEIRNGKVELLPEKVLEYIKNNKLYS